MHRNALNASSHTHGEPLRRADVGEQTDAPKILVRNRKGPNHSQGIVSRDRNFSAILPAGTNKIRAVQVTVGILEQLLISLHFEHGAPPAVTWLNHEADGPLDRAARLVGDVFGIRVARRSFHAGTQGDISLRMFYGI